MSFCVNGCRVSVSLPFAAAVAFLLFADSTGAAAAGLLAAAVHEGGHLAVMCVFGAPPAAMRFNPFGVDLKRGENRLSFGREALVALAGPAANLLLAGGLWLLHNPAFSMMLTANLILAGFNLLPVEPLDGGQALYAALCMRVSGEAAAKGVQVLSFFVVVPLAALGLLLLFQSRYNFTLLAVSAYLAALLALKRGRYF